MVWKNIPGWEGHYQVSSTGLVRSVDKIVKAKNFKGKIGSRFYKGRILKASPAANKYRRVSLSKKNKKIKFRNVHDLVMLAFRGKKPKGLFVLHWDDDRSNNKLSNLRYGTCKENYLDKIRNRK